MNPSSTPLYKEIQGQFELQQRFGQGSYGEVFKAEHKKTGKVVAIKKVFKGAQNLVKHMPEIRAMKSCVSPYILAYYGCEWLREDLLIAMEFCEYGSLADVMKIRSKAFNEYQVAYIMRRTLQALDYLATNNKVHRDIKPANIMLCGNGKVKLGDLGITKDLRPDGTLRDRIGSVLYLAPEIARDTPYTAKVDVWSLGITAVELLMGRAPRSNDRTKEILRQLVTEPQGPSLTSLPRHFSPLLRNFLQRCMQVDPANRPSAAELLMDPFIVKASSLSLKPLIDEMRSVVSLAGSFQSALAVSSNCRIEQATAEETLEDCCESDLELHPVDALILRHPGSSTSSTHELISDNIASEALGHRIMIKKPSNILHDRPFVLPPSIAAAPHYLPEDDNLSCSFESEGEINALVSRPIVDSPIWARPGNEVLQQAVYGIETPQIAQ